MPKFHFANDAARGRVVVVDLSHVRKGCSVVLPVASLEIASPQPLARGSEKIDTARRPDKPPVSRTRKR